LQYLPRWLLGAMLDCYLVELSDAGKFLEEMQKANWNFLLLLYIQKELA